MSKSITFALNGVVQKTTCRPDMTVLEWLRGEALLRGTKEGCAEGDCGACSVLVKRVGDEKYISANSCIMLMGQMEGGALLTVEGLAASGPDGHVVQQLMAENGSSQCGFCTPGIVTSLAGLLDKNPNPNESEIHDALAGNLCRCTGYRPIVEAAEAAVKANPVELPLPQMADAAAMVGEDGCRFFLPNSLKELLELRAAKPKATLLAGGTDLSLEVAHAKARWDETILTRNVAELRAIKEAKTHIVFGGAVTWQAALPLLQTHWPSFATLVRRFGSTQIRSMGTIAGNIGNASPIGDGAPSLLALDAVLTLASSAGEREVPLNDFFLDYRKSALKSDEIIRSITVPLPTKNTHFRTYKISKRYDQDISTVCGAFSLEVDGDIITKARIAYGGMAATSMRCKKAEALLIGKPLNSATITAAQKAILETFSPMSDMRGTAKYRATVAVNLLDRLALDLAGETIEVMAL
ncbi:MAG: xanthine dehydrogenase small subunit [Rhizobiaceae bacterium]